jgi:hypothetical protein
MRNSPNYYETLTLDNQASLQLMLDKFGHQTDEWNKTPEDLWNSIKNEECKLCYDRGTNTLVRQSNVFALSLLSPSGGEQLTVSIPKDNNPAGHRENTPLIIKNVRNNFDLGGEIGEVLHNIRLPCNNLVSSACRVEVANTQSNRPKYSDLRSKSIWSAHTISLSSIDYQSKGYSHGSNIGEVISYEWRKRYILADNEMWVREVLNHIQARYSVVYSNYKGALTISNELITINRLDDRLFVLDNRGDDQLVYTIQDYEEIKQVRSKPILKTAI